MFLVRRDWKLGDGEWGQHPKPHLPTANHYSRIFAVAAALLAIAGCGEDTPLGDLFHHESPYEEYVATLDRNGLDETALGQDWIRAGEQALTRAVSARLPFRETGYFPPETPAAVAYRLELRRGRTLAIDIGFDTARPGRIFVDLFIQRDTNPPERVASLGKEDSALSYDVRRDGTYLLRLQPELLRGGRWTVVERTLASLGFPVPGLGVQAVRSRFGAERDAGRRSHQGLDIFAPRGTPVIAIVDGYARASTNQLGGNVIWLNDASRGRTFYYAHLDRWAVDGGADVQVGDTLGFIGTTGNARTTPPHLHFGIYDGGPIDPLPFLAPDDSVPPPVGATTARLNQWVRIGTRRTDLRSGAHPEAFPIDVLAPGWLARVRATAQRTYRVELPDQSTGYVDAAAITGADRALTRIELDSGTVLRESPAESAPAVAVLDTKLGAEVLGTFSNFALLRLPDATLAWGASPPAAVSSRGARPQGWPQITTAFPPLDATKLIRRPGTNVVMYRTAAILEFVDGTSDVAKRRFFARNKMTVLGVTSDGEFFVRIPDPGTSIVGFDAYFDSLQSKPGILRALPVFQSGITPINGARPARPPLT